MTEKIRKEIAWKVASETIVCVQESAATGAISVFSGSEDEIIKMAQADRLRFDLNLPEPEDLDTAAEILGNDRKWFTWFRVADYEEQLQHFTFRQLWYVIPQVLGILEGDNDTVLHATGCFYTGEKLSLEEFKNTLPHVRESYQADPMAQAWIYCIMKDDVELKELYSEYEDRFEENQTA